MRRMTVLVVVAALALLALAGSAQAIVHGTAPIICAGAVSASVGKAGGVAALPALTDSLNPAPDPPMPAQGLAHASDAVC